MNPERRHSVERSVERADPSQDTISICLPFISSTGYSPRGPGGGRVRLLRGLTYLCPKAARGPPFNVYDQSVMSAVTLFSLPLSLFSLFSLSFSLLSFSLLLFTLFLSLALSLSLSLSLFSSLCPYLSVHHCSRSSSVCLSLSPCLLPVFCSWPILPVLSITPIWHRPTGPLLSFSLLIAPHTLLNGLTAW